ncbi:anther-specific proline-rich protein APG-like [Schistocerca piceifrons]|uniref:anther-specific proline-rich protein APG-like n=1 Tax=Schistocerca piceifrons TaxID=274613 RepID=UPI001F5FEC37|nr:anther-specific proline-rich protein APG-like [Schistocerca piceifrons]
MAHCIAVGTTGPSLAHHLGMETGPWALGRGPAYPHPYLGAPAAASPTVGLLAVAPSTQPPLPPPQQLPAPPPRRPSHQPPPQPPPARTPPTEDAPRPPPPPPPPTSSSSSASACGSPPSPAPAPAPAHQPQPPPPPPPPVTLPPHPLLHPHHPQAWAAAALFLHAPLLPPSSQHWLYQQLYAPRALLPLDAARRQLRHHHQHGPQQHAHQPTASDDGDKAGAVPGAKTPSAGSSSASAGAVSPAAASTVTAKSSGRHSDVWRPY